MAQEKLNQTKASNETNIKAVNSTKKIEKEANETHTHLKNSSNLQVLAQSPKYEKDDQDIDPNSGEQHKQMQETNAAPS